MTIDPPPESSADQPEPPENRESILESPLWDELLREVLSSEESIDSNDSADPQVPENFGRFRVLSRLGRGGMGDVYLADDPVLNRTVAIKVLRSSLISRPDAVSRFVREARILADLQHPGIVPIHELALESSPPWFAMKLISGRTLSEALLQPGIRGTRLDIHMTTFERAVDAVGFAHSRHVIHRDLKPANIMIGDFGEVQVVDWGLAKFDPVVRSAELHPEMQVAPPFESAIRAQQKTTHEESRVGSVMGTPSYMSPEQANGRIDAMDARTDVFALGSILCEIITGTPAYAGHETSEVLQQARQGDLSRALDRIHKAAVSDQLAAILKRCLDTDPARRFVDALELATALAAWRADEAQAARAAHANLESERVRAESALVMANEMSARTAAERRLRRLLMAIFGVAVVVLVAAAVGWSIVSARRVDRVRVAEVKIQSALADADLLRVKATHDSADGLETLIEARGILSNARSSLADAENQASLTTLLDDRLRHLESDIANARKRRLNAEREYRLFNSLNDLLDRRMMAFDGADPGQIPDGAQVIKVLKDHGYDLTSTISLDADIRSSPHPGRLVDLIGSALLASSDSRRKSIYDALELIDPNPQRNTLWRLIRESDFESLAQEAAQIEDVRVIGSASLATVTSILAATGHRDVARSVIEKAVAADPGSFVYQMRLAGVLAGFEGAATRRLMASVSAAALRPTSIFAWVSVLRAAKENGDRKWEEQAEERIETLILSKAVDPLTAAGVLVEAGFHKKAEEIALGALKKTLSGSEQAGFLFVCGLAALRTGRNAEAVEYFKMAVDFELSLDRVVLLGTAAVRAGRAHEFVEQFAAFSTQFPDQPEYSLAFAKLVDHSQGLREAEKILRGLVQKFSQYHPARCHLAVSLSIQNNYPAVLEQLLPMDGLSRACAYCRCTLADAMSRTGSDQREAIIEHYEAAFNMAGPYSFDPIARLNLLTRIAEGQLDLGRTTRGVAAAELAVRLDTSDGFANRVFGRALIDSGRSIEAIEPLNRAMAAEKGCAALKLRAVCAERLFQPADVEEFLERAMERPHDTEAERRQCRTGIDRQLVLAEKMQVAAKIVDSVLVKGESKISAEAFLNSCQTLVNLGLHSVCVRFISALPTTTFPEDRHHQIDANKLILLAICAAEPETADAVAVDARLRRESQLELCRRLLKAAQRPSEPNSESHREVLNVLETVANSDLLRALRDPELLKKIELREARSWTQVWAEITILLEKK